MGPSLVPYFITTRVQHSVVTHRGDVPVHRSIVRVRLKMEEVVLDRHESLEYYGYSANAGHGVARA